jgi:hypothetical protein
LVHPSAKTNVFTGLETPAGFIETDGRDRPDQHSQCQNEGRKTAHHQTERQANRQGGEYRTISQADTRRRPQVAPARSQPGPRRIEGDLLDAHAGIRGRRRSTERSLALALRSHVLSFVALREKGGSTKPFRACRLRHR